MGKKVRISDESVNCYGTRIITSGIDTAQYQRNPVLLYMHERGKVVGLVRNLRVENGELTGEMEFDEASPLSVQLKKQYDFGSLKMVSANLRILETSDDKALAMEGQTRQTITKCQLVEVSAVDIGGNDNALVLCNEQGDAISLSSEHESEGTCLPLLNNRSNNPLKKETEMETKQIALSLGLAETATEAEIDAKIKEMKLAQAQVDALTKEKKQLEQKQEQMALANITTAVETAIQEKRIAEGMKDHFIEMGKKVGLDSLKTTLDAIQPQGKISMQLRRTAVGQMRQVEQPLVGSYTKLSDVPSSEMDDLRDNHRADYIRLFKAEYGFEPEF